MSGLVGNPFLLTSAGAAGYQISRSLRFNSSDSAYLSRTPASAGNRKTWTWAGWVKRSNSDNSNAEVFGAGSNNLSLSLIGDNINVYEYNGSSTLWQRSTTAVYRDFSAWYHVVLAYDTTQATASNRIRLYINGAEVTQFSTNTNPTLNFDGYVNNNIVHYICYQSINGRYFNGYLADIHFIDGQALDPTSFGEFSATTGVWMPKAYTGTYGTNGFKLNFSDNSTAAALGTDTSGNGNTWTVNNLSVTAGAGNDSLVDVPTNGSEVDTGSGGQVRGNYCTWNPLSRLGDVTQTLNVSNGNLTFTTSSNGGTTGSVGMSSGKWYWELACSTLTASQLYFGITAATSSTSRVSGVIGIRDTGVLQNAGGATTNGSGTTAYTTGDIVQFAFDADNRRLFVGKNNTWLNSSDPAAGTGASFTDIPAGTLYAFISDNNTTATIDANFGQRPFAYTAPSGFKALCTANLPAPVVTKANQFFDVALWSGDGTSGRSIVLPGELSPDFVWTKMRNAANQHLLYDAVRGATIALATDNTNAETTRSTTITSFNSNGFTTGSSADTNGSGNTYVAWCWDAGSTTVTNTQGSITSSVRANATAGFSIVTYTGTGSNATVGHGLGVAPFMFIVKNRDVSSDWDVYHGSLASPATNRIVLQSTAAAIGAGGTSSWNSTNPTSTVVSLGSSTSGNANGNKHVMYCFAPVAGYSAMGSYTGNGSSTDGPFVFCNFRPKFLLIKRTDTSGYPWVIVDAARDGYNLTYKWLEPNSSSAEQTTQPVADADFLSNGFKLRGNGNTTNQSSGTYIYFAVAESPFNYARAR